MKTGTPKPALGYPSRTAAARALKEEGLTFAEIGTRIGITEKAVKDLIGTHRAKVEIKAGLPKHYKGIYINPEFRQMLRRDAAKRGLTTEGLIQLLVETIAKDKLVDAVLDDSDSQAEIAA